jgi:hypothetical protein
MKRTRIAETRKASEAAPSDRMSEYAMRVSSPKRAMKTIEVILNFLVFLKTIERIMAARPIKA